MITQKAIATCANAYVIGQKLRAAADAADDQSKTANYRSACMYWSYGWYTGLPDADAYFGSDDAGVQGFLLAGWLGLEGPEIATGTRLGNVPPSGRSRNYRDGEWERGVSMLTVNGSCAVSDGTFELWQQLAGADRPLVHVRGILLPFLGSDGEPLLVCCETIAAAAVAA